MLAGLPDLSAPLPALPGTVFRAFDRAGLVVALPDRLGLQAAPSAADTKGPVFLLTLLRGASGAIGRLDLGLAADADLAAIGRALAQAGEPATLMLAEAEGGVLALRASLGPVAPTTLAPPQPLTPDLLTRARITVDLSAEAASLAARLVEDATLPVDATLRLCLRAVAPRLPLVLSFDPKAIAARIAERLGDGAAVTMQAFGACLDALLTASVLVVESGEITNIDPDVRARTLALRLRDRFARMETTSIEAELRLVPSAEVPGGHERIDLAQPAAVITERLLGVDPFAAARLSMGGNLDRLVHRIDLPTLPFGGMQVRLTANLPEPVAGLAALFADLRAPAVPPFRPQPLTASVPLELPERRGTALLRLAPGEALQGEVRLRAVVMRHGQGVELTGPWRPAAGTAETVLGPDLFPLPLALFRLSPALAALASADIVAPDGETLARLDTVQSVAAVPRPTPEAALAVVLQPLGPGRTITLSLDATRRRCDLDPATLPGFGAHRARLVGHFAPGERPVIVEWRPEDLPPSDAAMSTRLGPDRPEAEIGWIAASPFRPGMVWRLLRDGVPGPWSEPLGPPDTDGLVIKIPERPSMQGDTAPDSLVIDGIELRPDPADTTTWIYVPPAPSLERRADGAPQLSLIEAGPVAFLQATTRVDLPEEARTRLFQQLRQARPDARAVRATPLLVRRMALETRAAGDDGWETLVEGTSSGTSPWTTALSATPGAAAVAAVKAAIAGERGRLRLSARIALPAPPATDRRTAFAADIAATQQSGANGASLTASVTASAAETTGGGPERTTEQVRDVAEFFVPN